MATRRPAARPADAYSAFCALPRQPSASQGSRSALPSSMSSRKSLRARARRLKTEEVHRRMWNRLVLEGQRTGCDPAGGPRALAAPTGCKGMDVLDVCLARRAPAAAAPLRAGMQDRDRAADCERLPRSTPRSAPGARQRKEVPSSARRGRARARLRSPARVHLPASIGSISTLELQARAPAQVGRGGGQPRRLERLARRQQRRPTHKLHDQHARRARQLLGQARRAAAQQQARRVRRLELRRRRALRARARAPLAAPAPCHRAPATRAASCPDSHGAQSAGLRRLQGLGRAAAGDVRRRQGRCMRAGRAWGGSGGPGCPLPPVARARLLAEDAARRRAHADVQRQLVGKLLALRGQARGADLDHEAPARSPAALACASVAACTHPNCTAVLRLYFAEATLCPAEYDKRAAPESGACAGVSQHGHMQLAGTPDRAHPVSAAPLWPALWSAAVLAAAAAGARPRRARYQRGRRAQRPCGASERACVRRASWLCRPCARGTRLACAAAAARHNSGRVRRRRRRARGGCPCVFGSSGRGRRQHGPRVVEHARPSVRAARRRRGGRRRRGRRGWAAARVDRLKEAEVDAAAGIDLHQVGCAGRVGSAHVA